MKEALNIFAERVREIEAGGMKKTERVITSPQGGSVTISDGRQVINLCSNNYLGLCQNPQIIEAAKQSYDQYGYGLSSVRFICGTQDIHKQLESAVSAFLETEDTILYSSCFDANGGLFESLLDNRDAVISDELNHASIIDGVRLCKATRYRYKNNDMADLREKLEAACDARIKLIVTDGVFSMDGIIANLKGICDLAEEYGALVMVDDSHGVGFLGRRGRGSHEHCGVMGRVDILTGTFGKALGGASGGYTSGRKEIINLLRQVSRPYLFSNTLAPSIAAGTLKVLEILSHDTSYRDKLFDNVAYFSEKIKMLGFDIINGGAPIVPVMLYDEKLAANMAEKMLEKGVYVVAFSYPVVPRGKARIRTQMSAALSYEQIDAAVAAFSECKKELGI